MPLAHEALLECAVDAARAAGEHALANLARRTESLETLRHDVKLALDVECQAKAEGVIRAMCPGHDVLGEEDNGNGNGEYRWIIDPIDGTVNFSHGMPQWCCSVAVQRKGETVAAAVFAPALDELYTATLDGSARLNGDDIRVSDVETLARAVVRSGLDQKVNPDLRKFAILEAVGTHTQRVRIMGSAALDICHVACGQADGYFESNIFLWDVAAAGLVCTRAGGRTDTLRSYENYRLCFIATNGHLFEELKSLVAPMLPPV